MAGKEEVSDPGSVAMATPTSDLPLIQLPADAIDDITELIRYRDHILPFVEKSVGQPPAGSLAHFSFRMSRALRVNPEILYRVATPLWGIRFYLGQLATSDPKSLRDALRHAIDNSTDERWKEGHLAEWNQTVEPLSKALAALTDDHPLMISAKTHTLAYSHEHLFINSRIISDVRPVFNTAGNEVLATVIMSALVINYSKGQGPSDSIVFVLDQKDVKSLREQCERAEQKASVLAERLQTLNPIVFPEEVKE